MARKTAPKSAAARQAARRARLRREGARQVLVTMPPDTARRLDALPGASDAGKIVALIDATAIRPA